jgi:hypothetical protein
MAASPNQKQDATQKMNESNDKVTSFTRVSSTATTHCDCVMSWLCGMTGIFTQAAQPACQWAQFMVGMELELDRTTLLPLLHTGLIRADRRCKRRHWGRRARGMKPAA